MTVFVEDSLLGRFGGLLAEEAATVTARVSEAVAEEQQVIEEAALSAVPVLTGRLKGTIRPLGSGLRRRVRAAAFYGRFVEFGTVHMAANPFLITQANREERAAFERRVLVAVEAGRIYR